MPIAEGGEEYEVLPREAAEQSAAAEEGCEPYLVGVFALPEVVVGDATPLGVGRLEVGSEEGGGGHQCFCGR